MDWKKIKNYFSKEYRLYHRKIYIDLGFHKLYKDWFKSRRKLDVKKLPKLKFYKGDCGLNIWCDYYMDCYASFNSFKNKLFAFHIEPLGYKYKWGYWVYSYAPEIVCVFNKKIIFTIRLQAPDGCEYGTSYWQQMVNIITKEKKD